MATKRPVVKNWRVKVRCVVEKSVYCTDCTEDEARKSPFDHSVDEQETAQMDWEVIGVQEEE